MCLGIPTPKLKLNKTRKALNRSEKDSQWMTTTDPPHGSREAVIHNTQGKSQQRNSRQRENQRRNSERSSIVPGGKHRRREAELGAKEESAATSVVERGPRTATRPRVVSAPKGKGPTWGWGGINEDLPKLPKDTD